MVNKCVKEDRSGNLFVLTRTIRENSSFFFYFSFSMFTLFYNSGLKKGRDVHFVSIVLTPYTLLNLFVLLERPNLYIDSFVIKKKKNV